MDNNEVINKVCEEFAEQFINSLQRSATSRIDTDQKFDVDFIKSVSGSAAVITAEFAAHLRLFDMRKVSRQSGFDKRGIASIKQWIERKGVSSFLKGYKYPTQVKKKGGVMASVPVTRIINNIAWGISQKKKPLKRKKWYNSQKGSSVYALYARLVDAVLDNSLKEMKENVLNNQAQ